MSLEPIKNAIHQGINELFASAVLHEMAGDIDSCREVLSTIVLIADTLGIKTEMAEITLSLNVTIVENGL